jgi:hypothetical protein
MTAEEEEELEYTAELVKHRQVFRRVPQAIDRLLNRVISRRGVSQVQSREELLAAWQAVCDPEFLVHTRVVSLRNKRLEIRVANSLINQHLNFDKVRLLAALQQRLPEAKLQGLVFKTGPVEAVD